MSRIHKTLVVLCAVLVVGTARANEDEDRYVVSFSKTFTFHGGRITVDNRFGSLVVRTESGSQVSVRAKIRASSPEYGQRIRIITSEKNGGINIATTYPEMREHMTNGENSFSVDYDITVPTDAPLTLRNRFGDTYLGDHNGPATIESSHGKISVRNGDGAKTIENRFGPIEVVDQRGDVVVRTNNGGIDIRNIGGAVDVANRFGNVAIVDVRKKVAVKNTNGTVQLRNIGGPIAIINAYAGVTAVDIRGSADITSTNGKVEARNVGGETSIRNDFGSVSAVDIRGGLAISGRNLNVEARNVHGPAAISSAYGTISAVEISGPVSVSTSFGSTSVRDVGGPVAVENQNGSIVVSGLHSGRCQPISLKGSYSSIKLRIPSSAGYSVSARTSSGRITSTIPMTQKIATDDQLIGTIGNGACKMELINDNGNISISEE